ncbi:hypothetical protein KGQ34_00150 [Patescibacteria group bacterium]|nr:hypothetical protein [Patescibacteria group bacterium]
MTAVFCLAIASDNSFSQTQSPMAPPPLIQKMIQARALLEREKLEKEIAVAVEKQTEKKLSAAQNKKNNRRQSKPLFKKQYRIAGAESLLAVDAGDEIKIIRLWETWPKLHQHGFAFEVLSPEGCDAEYAGGDGINRRFRVMCAGYDEPLPMLGRVMLALRAKNLFSSPDEIARAEKEKNIRMIVYSPFADEFVTPEHVAYGDYVLREEVVHAAYRRLEELGVLSRAYPGELVANVISEVFMYITAVIEHGDHGEFEAWGIDFIRKKVLTTIAQNQLAVYPSCNDSRACGLMQGTNNASRSRLGTYDMVRAQYPDALLNSKFPESMFDPVNAVMFSVLLYDYELSQLPEWVRSAYKKDSRSVVLCIATAYHSGGGRAADFCGKPAKSVSLDSFQFPKRFQKKYVQLGYYLRKFIDLEHLLNSK